jgi:hypothetical protein
VLRYGRISRRSGCTELADSGVGMLLKAAWQGSAEYDFDVPGTRPVKEDGVNSPDDLYRTLDAARRATLTY